MKRQGRVWKSENVDKKFNKWLFLFFVARLCLFRLKTILIFLAILFLWTILYDANLALSLFNERTNTLNTTQQLTIVQFTLRHEDAKKANEYIFNHQAGPANESKEPVQIDHVQQPVAIQEVETEHIPKEELQAVTLAEEIQTESPEDGEEPLVVYDRDYLSKFQRFDVGKAKLSFMPEFKSPCFLEYDSGKQTRHVFEM